jgi:hypothetical protein
MVSFLTDSWDAVEKVLGLNGKTTANVAGMNPTQAKIATGAATTQNLGLITSVFGGINSAIGSYYAAQSAQYQAKSNASSLEFQSDMDALNARSAELSAQSILEQGKTQVEQYTMQAGQQKASTIANMGARGIVIGEGSSRDVLASQDLVKDLDVLTINSNATRAAWAERTAATNYSNKALLDRTSASNMRATAGSISPGLAVGTSLLGSATGVASQWDWRRRLAMSTAGGLN